LLEAGEGALGVHREDSIPLLGGDLEQRQVGDDPGARDETVDPAELALGQVEHRFDIRKRRHVGALVPHIVLELSGRGRQPIAVEICQHHSRTLAAGGVRDGTAHAGRGTGHDDDLIAKAQKVGHGRPS